MRRPSLLMLVMVAIVGAAALATSGQGQAEKAAGKAAGGPDNVLDFGRKALYIITKPSDTKGTLNFSLFEEVKIIPLGERYWVVGRVPNTGDEAPERSGAGKWVWTPINDILQMTEFNDIEDAKRVFNARRRPESRPGAPPRPQ